MSFSPVCLSEVIIVVPKKEGGVGGVVRQIVLEIKIT